MDKKFEMVYDLIMDKVMDDKKGPAKELLEGVFAGLEDGKLDMNDFKDVAAKVMPMIKPDSVEDVKDAVETFVAGNQASDVLGKVKGLFN